MTTNQLHKENWNLPTDKCEHSTNVACSICNPQLWHPTESEAKEYCTEWMTAEILKAKDLYYNHGTSYMSDLAYDRLESSLKAINLNAQVLQKVGTS